ncbi:hypothetical protein AAC387_Pa01g1416 [Persea americana]
MEHLMAFCLSARQGDRAPQQQPPQQARAALPTPPQRPALPAPPIKQRPPARQGQQRQQARRQPQQAGRVYSVKHEQVEATDNVVEGTIQHGI